MNINPETIDAIVNGFATLGGGLGAYGTDKLFRISDRISSRYPRLGKFVQVAPEAVIYGAGAYGGWNLLKGLSELVFH